MTLFSARNLPKRLLTPLVRRIDAVAIKSPASRHGLPRDISVPQMPRGKNSTKTMKTTPTTTFQCVVQSVTTIFEQQEHRGADEGPEEGAHAAEQAHHHRLAGGA